MVHDIAFALWFLLPAALANVAPIISAKAPLLKNWSAPIDGGRTFRGKQLLGSHKTWRGIIIGMLVSTAVFFLQQVAYGQLHWAKALSGNVDYSVLPTLVLGPLFGLGALGGDAIESFFKRQRGIPSGASWIPFDQLDYIVGGIIVTLPFVRLSLAQYIWLFVVWFVLHLVASYIGWRTGFKEQPI